MITKNTPFVFFLFILCTAIAGSTVSLYLANTFSDRFRIIVFDVGQGSSALIETPRGTQVLIDTGISGAALPELGDSMDFFDRTIDALVLTHFDSDHIGGALEILSRYNIRSVYVPYLPDETDPEIALQIIESAKQNNTQIIDVDAGDSMLIDDAVIEFLWPYENVDDETHSSNDTSIVLRVTYNNATALFPGDASKVIEDIIVETYGDVIDSDMLLLGHHGSDTSTSARFIETVTPDVAIVSAGRGNSYGHPHQSVVATVSSAGIPIVSTAIDGNIIFVAEAGRFVRE
jgi:competence protein ComEC